MAAEEAEEKLNLEQFVSYLKQHPDVQQNIRQQLVFPSVPASYRSFPPELDIRLVNYLKQRGIRQPYSHQAEVWQHVLAGKDVVVVTPTASGKTLCYNVPVLDRILSQGASRALYLFPTKALAQDQVVELQRAADAMQVDIRTFTYDGDTPPTARQLVRTAGHIVVTNPDMLHTGIMPHHTKWVKLFQNLDFVVIDELHTYRGVFGSHVANVIRRLLRLCRFYGSNPQFICSSATIANPKQLAEQLLGREVQLVDKNGAPRSERHLLFYNPPVINAQLGIRRSSLLEATRLARLSLGNRLQTIVFGRSRQSVELILTYLREGKLGNASVAGYRGGYLPGERRRIEAGLRSGEIMGVVSTSALELGVDIGQLEVCILAGYPGTIASAWQQMGRVGRRQGASLAIVVASSHPLDQYLMQQPEYFLGASPEHGLINPDNLSILVSHLKCGAFELPFSQSEVADDHVTQEVLDFLTEAAVLRKSQGRYFWMSESFPAEEIGLRSASIDNFVIIRQEHGQSQVIGEIDRLGAMTTVHEQAIYLHGGQQYHVDRLDFGERKAYVHPVDVDYYTDANLAVNLQVLSVLEQDQRPACTASMGEVAVTIFATIFKKVRLYTHENVGWGRIRLPEEQVHTTAFWVSVDQDCGYSADDLQSGLVGISNLLRAIAPVFLLTDSRDLGIACQVKAPFTGQPTVFLYDMYPGGIGLAEKLYTVRRELLEAALGAVDSCVCRDGCPSCVGPASEVGAQGKQVARLLLQQLQQDRSDNSST
ncbi:MAG: DEAD/DEAH box helicase [Bacillota bacterium]|jgi:DEAD/DEAH box helicase domain-containing protein